MFKSEDSKSKARQIFEETLASCDIAQIEGYASDKIPLILDILKSYFDMIQTLPNNKLCPPLARGNPIVGLMKLSMSSLESILKEVTTLREIYDLSKSL